MILNVTRWVSVSVAAGLNHDSVVVGFLQTEIEDYENGDYHYDQLGDKNHSVPSRDVYRNLQERCDKV